jgi:7-cyano-7-deazaguanine synthase in queuosine biosynthesis
VRNAQRNAFEYLDKLHPSIFKWTPIFVTGKTTPDHKYMFPSDNQREDTQRTRSFLFLTLAGIFAHRRGNRDIIFIAENGQLAIHLPFTGARISSFSTHTAHPEVINGMSEVLSSLLSYEIKVINPFVYLTKAEVIRDLLQNHMSAAKLAVSCWKASRVVGERNHCGECIPCLIRRIAVESNGVHFDEYARDIFSEDIASLKPDDEGKHNITDLGDFINIFEKRVSKSEILDKHIDLINPFIDVDKAINMYRKFAKEARSVFNSYPILKEYMK